MTQLNSASSAARSVNEELRRAFEAAWFAGRHPTIEDFLPDPTDASYLATLEELVHIDLEIRWKQQVGSGDGVLTVVGSASVEQYCERFPVLRQPERMARLYATEQSVRARFGNLIPPGHIGPERYVDTGPPSLITAHTNAVDALPQTLAHDARPEPKSQSTAPYPSRLGRYEVDRQLGAGGFGFVVLARDEQLNRLVAIKIPRAALLTNPESVAAQVNEARIVAALDHPHIAPVYDVGATPEYPYYIVSKYVAGESLADRLRRERPSLLTTAELVAAMASALTHAHAAGIVHRDIKPSNILLDEQGHPYLVDFGLALKDVELGTGPHFAGTPAYMSPEQARGEGHRVDGRADIYSLGVVCYEMLVGRRPFQDATIFDLLEAIANQEVTPPRSVDDAIPVELERICLKMLARRASDRYASADELRADMDEFLAAYRESKRTGFLRTGDTRTTNDASASAEAAPPSASARVVPKGLQAFDGDDADFFLQLVPGPRDREGLPESVRFWKTRIESRDPTEAFSVAALYGPSGCGKSSLVKAGVLPRLGPQVRTIFVECRAAGTEAQLEKQLCQACPALPPGQGLLESLLALRRGRGLPPRGKVLLVLDQFEQWLSGQIREDEPLVAALRQCDGANLQCLVLVRDDFWMSLTRFLQALEVRLAEGRNYASVDLFPLAHAQRVLVQFGQAYNAGLLRDGETTGDREQFAREAVALLAEDGLVIPVKLALFADMMKDKPWTTSTLRRLGGLTGLGLKYLEETFEGSSAPPHYRFHHATIHAVLGAFLNAVTAAQVKGRQLPRSELLAAAELSGDPRALDTVIGILDRDLHLITPVEAHEESDTPKGNPSYQLTHDYLIPPLRAWSLRRQKKSARGRAELRLKERAEWWQAKPESRNLPSWWEFLQIRLLTRSDHWSDAERQVMQASNRYHVLRAGLLLAALSLIALAILGVSHRLEQQNLQRQGRSVAEHILSADIRVLPEVLPQRVPQIRAWTDGVLATELRRPEAEPPRKWRAALALKESAFRSIEEMLPAHLPGISAAETRTLVQLLPAEQTGLIEQLWKELSVVLPERGETVLPTAALLAAFDPQDDRWRTEREKVATALLHASATQLGDWLELLRPVGIHLIEPLATAFRGAGEQGEPSLVAASVLSEFVANDPRWLARLVADANAQQFALLYPHLARHRQQAMDAIQEHLSSIMATRNPASIIVQPRESDVRNLMPLFESAAGYLAIDHALCLAMPWKDFVAAMDPLKAAGYRPLRCRPYRTSQGLQCAAVWCRDGRDFDLRMDLTVQELAATQMKKQEAGWNVSEYGGYVQDGASGPEDRYLAIWIPRQTGEPAHKLTVAVSERELAVAADPLVARGELELRGLSVFIDTQGRRRYCPTVAVGSTPTRRDAAYDGRERLDLPQFDIAVAPARPHVRRLVDQCNADLRRATEVLEKLPLDRAARLNAIEAHLCLGNLEPARKLLESFGYDPSDTSDLWTEFFARQGSASDSLRQLQLHFKGCRSPPHRVYLEALRWGLLGDFDQADEALQKFVVPAAHDDGVGNYYLARCYARLSGLKQPADPSRSEHYRQRAMERLRSACDNQHFDRQAVLSEPDLESLRDHADYKALLDELFGSHGFAGVWCARPEIESRVLRAEDFTDHVRKARELALTGFRPVAICAGALRETSLVSASVWHRPLPTEDDKERIGKQQANCAAALMRLGLVEPAWRMLDFAPERNADPRTRSYLIHRLVPFGVEPAVIAERALTESNTSVLRALLVALGEWPKPPDSHASALVARLANLFDQHPDPGVHGAAEWTLRKWGYADQIRLVTERLASGIAQDQRQWYITKNAQLTMVLLDPHERVLIGSPITEVGRLSPGEELHWRRFDRRFAISAREVTIEQYRLFRKEHRFFLQNPPIPDAPAHNVSWYEAAAFCNWLSKVEGIPEHQWCYDPTLPFANGLMTGAHYLQRTGYRLPTEAEWEYACRAGAVTARYFGETSELLPFYAWYSDVSHDLVLRSTGSLKPNDFGLFDMLGNANEWCHAVETYKVGMHEAHDHQDIQQILDSKRMPFRGGSMFDRPRHVRASHLMRNEPTNEATWLGFRVVRTMK